MTDETKKLFSAPWTVKHHVHACWEVDFEISTVDRMRVAVSPTEEHANRIARIPELYEELKSASYDFCWSCLATLGIDPPTADELIENLCPRKPSCCGYNNRWKLLQKVRDGE